MVEAASLERFRVATLPRRLLPFPLWLVNSIFFWPREAARRSWATIFYFSARKSPDRYEGGGNSKRENREIDKAVEVCVKCGSGGGRKRARRAGEICISRERNNRCHLTRVLYTREDRSRRSERKNWSSEYWADRQICRLCRFVGLGQYPVRLN